MSERFKQQLKDYAEGKLSAEEKVEVEKELEKMEAYQAYLDEVMGEENRVAGQEPQQDESDPQAAKRERRIIQKGKWRARISNAFTVLAIFIVFSIISSLITALYFGTGSPNRGELYRDVIRSAVAVTQPNISLNLSFNTNAYYNVDFKGQLNKQIGDARINIGDFSMNMFLGLPRSKDVVWRTETEPQRFVFVDPNRTKLYQGEKKKSAESGFAGEWATLDKLPEGTVAEAFLSLDRFYSTEELLKMFDGKNMSPEWFAVYTGDDSGTMSPIGFPYYPMWHHDDWTMTGQTVEKRGLFGKTVSRGNSAPPVDSLDGKIRNENFIKTLYLLQKYKRIANYVAFDLNLDARISYLEENGIQLYGVAVTGPTKELLKLRDEDWIASIQLGEVRLWNWNNR